MNEYLVQFLALTGVAAFISMLINVLKAAGVVKDGAAPTWSLFMQLAGFVALVLVKVIGLPVDVAGLDGIAQQIAEVGVAVLQLVTMLGAGRVAHAAVKGSPLVGFSYSAKKA